MTGRHPGKTPAQRRALDEIGCGNYSPIMAKSTRDALLKEDLIEPLSDKVIGTGPFAVHVPQFQMPLWAHLAWCSSCVDEESPNTPDHKA